MPKVSDEAAERVAAAIANVQPGQNARSERARAALDALMTDDVVLTLAEEILRKNRVRQVRFLDDSTVSVLGTEDEGPGVRGKHVGKSSIFGQGKTMLSAFRDRATKVRT